MKITVLFLCDYKSIYGGNFIPSLMAIEEELCRHGGTAVYVFPQDAKSRYWYQTMVAMGKKVDTCDFSGGRLHRLGVIKNVIRKYKANIIHMHFYSVFLAELLGLLTPSLSVFIHIHSDFDAGNYGWKQRVRDFLLYRVFSAKVKFLSVSKAFEKQNPKRITWIPNALAKERISCRHIGGDCVRKQLNVGQSDIVAEIFGWSPHVKGVDIAVNAVKMVNEMHHHAVKLAIICGREMTPDKMKDWIASHTECTGNEPYLAYLEPIEDVYSYHEAADMLISASRSEGFSYSILEMLSVGKRCVVSDIPGTAWACKYDTVKSFEGGNSASCAESIVNAIDTLPAVSSEVAEAVGEEYCIDKWTRCILQAYGAAN